MDTIIRFVVDTVVVPLADSVPFLASRGILLAVFAAMWILFGVALVRDRPRLDAAWRRIRRMPFVVQAVAWLLFLPVLAGLWVWKTSWPVAARMLLIAGIAGWNILVFLPTAA